ncbi:Ig-like domain-containing protein [Variovorax boronicumulans]
MATKKKTKVVVNSNGKNIDHTVEAAANGKAPLKIKVGKGAKYLLKGEDGFAPENVTLTRVGADLQVTLEGESSPSLVLEGYYAQSEPVGLYGVAEDGQLYAYARTDAAGDIYTLSEGQSAPVALGGDSFGSGVSYLAGTEAGGDSDFFGGMFPLLMTGGLAALGLGAIAAASGSDGDPAPSLPPVAPPVVQPPGKPGFDGIGGAYDDVGLVQGPIERGGKTDDTRPDFHGTGTPGNTVTVYDKGTAIGKVVVDESGKWNFTPPKDLGDGQHSITITESDAGGRESVPSDPFEFGVDITPPVQPGWNGEGPNAVIDDVGTITGSVPPGGATDDPRPEFNGQGAPGSTIIVQDKGVEIGTVVVNDNGQWTFTPPKDLGEGDHSITIIERDPVGNQSKPSNPFEFDVDTIAPEKPTLGGVIDNMGDIQGPIAPGGITDDRQPEFHGQGTPGDTIIVKDKGTVVGTADVGDDGKWTFIPSTDLGEGDHSITIVERDPAGNESPPSDPFDFVIDVTPPDASKLALTGVTDDVGAVQGNVASGETTDDALPLLSGTSAGAPGHTVVVWVENSTGTHKLGEAVIGEGGKWTLQVGTPLAAGANAFTVVEHDAAGNETFPTEPYTITVDTGRPEVPVIQNVKDDVGVVQTQCHPYDRSASGQVDRAR